MSNQAAPVAIISASLHPESNSRLLARAAETALRAGGVAVDFIDLREHALPLCDGDSAYAHAAVAPLQQRIAAAERILVATPVYNYDVNAAVKNLLELTGRAWAGKIVGFACAAGGGGSYMSVMGFANSLMLDYRCWIVPRFVYAEGSAFSADGIASAEVSERIAQLCAALLGVRVS